jgi:hypothetical protein
MARQISMGARREVVWAVAERYGAAGRREKGRILDELCATMGWHREHAVRALGRHGTGKPAGRRNGPLAGASAMQRKVCGLGSFRLWRAMNNAALAALAGTRDRKEADRARKFCENSIAAQLSTVESPGTIRRGRPFRGRRLTMIGHRVWAIPEGYIPGRSFSQQPDLVSHAAACILNTSDEPAEIDITLYSADRDPAGLDRVTVEPRRTKHMRFNSPSGPGRTPRDAAYSYVLRSNVPVVVQRTWLDSRDPHIALFSMLAFPVES